MKKILIAVLLNICLTAIVITSLIIYAQNVYPAAPIYTLKRLHETAIYSLQLSPQSKINYSRILLEKRLQEIIRVNDSGKHKDLLTTSLRYSSTAGRITDLIELHGLKEEIKPTITVFEKHQKVLQTMEDTYIGNHEEVKFLTDSINYLTTYIDRLSKL